MLTGTTLESTEIGSGNYPQRKVQWKLLRPSSLINYVVEGERYSSSFVNILMQLAVILHSFVCSPGNTLSALFSSHSFGVNVVKQSSNASITSRCRGFCTFGQTSLL